MRAAARASSSMIGRLICGGLGRMADASPTLEMLWESVDPGDTLQTRFGFESTDGVVAWVASALGDAWGVRVDSCERIVMSDGNALAWVGTSSGRMVAKWSIAPERFTRLAALARLTAWLAEEGLPVSAPVPTSSGLVQVEIDGASLCLQREIAGDLLDASDPHQVWAAGATLSRLHEALAAYPRADGIPAAVASPRLLAVQIDGWLESGPERVPPKAREALRRLVAEAPPEDLPVQLVHGDFRSANVLCARQEVVAVLDFEEARFDHQIVELGRSAALIGTRFHDWGPVSSEVRSQFLDGYQSVRPLTPIEAAWWPVVVLWSSMVMVPPGEDRAGWGSATLDYVSELGLCR